jgi:hypothetical protein
MTRDPTPLALKPDLADAAKRWDAYLAGEMVDRPLVMVTAPREGCERVPAITYHDRAFGDLNELVDRALRAAEGTFYGGEAIPAFWPSFGPDEIAVFCGAELCWSDDSGDTNWSEPFVENWEEALPFQLQQDHPLWQRMLSLYRLAAQRLAGKMAMSPLDLHSNMDLVAAARGPQRLCVDLLDRPEVIDRAMASARAVFPELWRAIVQAGRMDDLGYCHGFYSMEGAAVLQCDFSCMIGPEMFRRWVLPALEEEAEIVGHAYYHWDGPGALKHLDSLVASKGLHTLSYVPGASRGGHIEYLDLFKRVQAGGKAMHFSGSPDEVKAAHRELRPDKTMYSTWCGCQADAEALLEWLVGNT